MVVTFDPDWPPNLSFGVGKIDFTEKQSENDRFSSSSVQLHEVMKKIPPSLSM